MTDPRHNKSVPLQLPTPGRRGLRGLSEHGSPGEGQSPAGNSRSQDPHWPNTQSLGIPGEEQTSKASSQRGLTPADPCRRSSKPRSCACTQCPVRHTTPGWRWPLAPGLRLGGLGTWGLALDPEPSVRVACGARTPWGLCLGRRVLGRWWKSVDGQAQEGLVRSMAALGGTLARSLALGPVQAGQGAWVRPAPEQTAPRGQAGNKAPSCNSGQTCRPGGKAGSGSVFQKDLGRVSPAIVAVGFWTWGRKPRPGPICGGPEVCHQRRDSQHSLSRGTTARRYSRNARGWETHRERLPVTRSRPPATPPPCHLPLQTRPARPPPAALPQGCPAPQPMPVPTCSCPFPGWGQTPPSQHACPRCL